MKNIKIRNLITFAFIAMFCGVILVSGCGETPTTNISVDGIQISKKNIYLAEGQTNVVTAQVFPFNATNQNVMWISSNNDVVSVEDGFITAKKAGDAVIEVMSEDGGYKDTCNILVTTARDNLELNDYNNMNMPPKDLQPIVDMNSKRQENKNGENNNSNSNYTTKQNTKKSLKNNTHNEKSKNNINNSRIHTNKKTIKNANKIYNNSKLNNKKSVFGFGHFGKTKEDLDKENIQTVETLTEAAKTITNKEIEDIKTSAINVANDIKNDVNIMFDHFKFKKSKTYANETLLPEFNIITNFKNFQNDLINEMNQFKNDMITELNGLEEKILSDEYTVEKKDINGVTFVVVKNK